MLFNSLLVLGSILVENGKENHFPGNFPASRVDVTILSIIHFDTLHFTAQFHQDEGNEDIKSYSGIPQLWTMLSQTDGRRFACDLNDFQKNPEWIKDLIDWAELHDASKFNKYIE